MEAIDILEEMLKSEDGEEHGKAIIKDERSGVENYITEAMGVKIENNEHIAPIKYEELYIKNEFDNEEEGDASEPILETEDCNDSEENASASSNSQIRKSASKAEQLHFCLKCPFSTKYKRSLNRHMHTHSDTHPDRPNSRESTDFQCHYCDYKSNMKQNLKVHISAIHEREKAAVYSCQQCTYKTVHAGSLRRHLMLHGEKVSPHKCPGCEKGYSEKRALDNHLLKTHDSLQYLITSRIYDCKFCAYKSTQIQHMKCHVMVKHDRKNAERFQCQNCNFCTLHKALLIGHLSVHSNSSLHQCPSCKKGYSQKCNLDSHILKKHKDNAVVLETITSKIHQCTFCTFKTVRRTDIVRHIKAKHK